jgi:hypothetical protein
MIKKLTSFASSLKSSMRMGKAPKKRTNRPMIERNVYETISSKDKTFNRFAARQRLRRMGSDTSLKGQGIQMLRYFKKASPKKKAIIIGLSVGPKAALVGTGYFLNRQDDKE